MPPAREGSASTEFPAAVISMDQGGHVTYWNPGAERMFGIGRADALGRAVAELIIPPTLRDSHDAGLERFLRSGIAPMLDRRIELSALRADGTEFPVELTISAMEHDGTWTFTGFVQDISEREQTEKAVEELRQALLGAERRFDAVVGSFSDPVTIRDHDDRIIYANQAALRHLGFESLDALRATSAVEIMADYEVTDEDGGAVVMEQIPSVRLLRGEEAKPLVIRTVDRRTGQERWNLLKAAPLQDAAGNVEATIQVIEDVTEQKRAERRARFLAQASEILASSLDYEQTLRNVAQLAVPGIVDWCAIDLVDAGRRTPVGLAHADPTRIKVAEELREFEPAQLDPERGLGLAVVSGQTLVYPEITDEMLVASATSDRHLELLRRIEFQAVAIVPMSIGTRTLGALTLVNADSGRALERFDIELVEQLAAQAAVAVENARIYSERARIAHTLQQSLLPDVLPEIPGFELASLYAPAFESTEVGGDFYDAWQVGDTWMLAIGDVTGKGTEAAALTALVRHTLRAMSEFLSSPAELLARLDATLKRRPRSICTALCLSISDRGIALAAGGQPLPIRIGDTGACAVGEPGPLLGALDGAVWDEQAIELQPGETLVMYTDGVTDVQGEGRERYGPQRLLETLAGCAQQPPEAVIEELRLSLRAFQVGANADDTAILALRRVPRSDS